MKKMFCLFSFVCVVPFFSYPQTINNQKPKHEAAFDFGSMYTPVLSENLFGVNIDIRYYPCKRFATGLCSSFSEKKKTDNSFTYSIGQPLIDFYEIGWVNQFDFIQSNCFRMGLNINNGMAAARLSDNSVKEKYWTKYGYRERAVQVAANYFFLVEPGMDISVKLFSMNRNPDFYLTAKTKYRFLYGDCKYGEIKDFSNYYLGLAISIIGFTQ